MNKIKALIIDVLLYPLTTINNKDFNIFFVLFEPIKHIKVMATHFSDQSFSHSLINNGNYLFNDIKLSNTNYTFTNFHLFVYIAIKQYLSDEFYGIMINTRISKYLIVDYKQYKIYEKNIKNTSIRIFKVIAIHFKFSIGPVLFMRSIIIEIYIKLRKFHIIKSNTTFLLFLADIN